MIFLTCVIECLDAFVFFLLVYGVEALRPDNPRSCQVDARFQPRLSSGSVAPAKDVRTGCPDTPSDGFVSLG